MAKDTTKNQLGEQNIIKLLGIWDFFEEKLILIYYHINLFYNTSFNNIIKDKSKLNIYK